MITIKKICTQTKISVYCILDQGYLVCLTLHAPTQSQRTALILRSVVHEGSLRTCSSHVPSSQQCDVNIPNKIRSYSEAADMHCIHSTLKTKIFTMGDIVQCVYLFKNSIKCWNSFDYLYEYVYVCPMSELETWLCMIWQMYNSNSFWGNKKKTKNIVLFLSVYEMTIRSVMCNCDDKPLSLFPSPCEIDLYQSLPHPTIPASCSGYRLMDCELLCYYSQRLQRMWVSKHTTKSVILKLDLPLKSDFNLVWPRFRWCFAMFSWWCENYVCVTMGVKIRFVWLLMSKSSLKLLWASYSGHPSVQLHSYQH